MSCAAPRGLRLHSCFCRDLLLTSSIQAMQQLKCLDLFLPDLLLEQ